MKKTISLLISILITLCVVTVMLCNVSAANNESVASGYYEPTELSTEAPSIVTPSTAAPLPTASETRFVKGIFYQRYCFLPVNNKQKSRQHFRTPSTFSIIV